MPHVSDHVMMLERRKPRLLDQLLMIDFHKSPFAFCF